MYVFLSPHNVASPWTVMFILFSSLFCFCLLFLLVLFFHVIGLLTPMATENLFKRAARKEKANFHHAIAFWRSLRRLCLRACSHSCCVSVRVLAVVTAVRQQKYLITLQFRSPVHSQKLNKIMTLHVKLRRCIPKVLFPPPPKKKKQKKNNTHTHTYKFIQLVSSSSSLPFFVWRISAARESRHVSELPRGRSIYKSSDKWGPSEIIYCSRPGHQGDTTGLCRVQLA